MYTCSAGRCWFVLFYFAVRQIKELELIVRLEASLLGGAGVEEDRSQDYRTADEAGTTSALGERDGRRTLLGQPNGRYFRGRTKHMATGFADGQKEEARLLLMQLPCCSSRGLQRFSATEGVSDRSRSTQRKQRVSDDHSACSPRNSTDMTRASIWRLRLW